jgi:aminocarboxymuconate-semialdehyde decarboxylase
VPTIDLHAHAIVPDAVRAMHEAHPDEAPELTEEEGVTYLAFPGRERLGPLHAGTFDPAARLADMDGQRVDLQVIAVPPAFFHYHVAGTVGSDFARIQNDGLMALSDSNPARFHVFATLALQDVPAALDEIDRIVAHPRVRGIQIGTNVDGTDLDDAGLSPVWQALESADLPVWVHPDQRSLAGKDRLSSYYLQNLIGNPLESTIAIARLIFGGVLERHQELRFGFVHGGGFAPYQTGRWNHGWKIRNEPKSVIAGVEPGKYLGRMFFDSLTHDAASLGLLGRRVGWSNVVLGSDYPFDMGSADPVGSVEATALTEDQQRAVLESNADRFLRPIAEAPPVAW